MEQKIREEIEDYCEDDGTKSLINVMFYQQFGFLKSKKDFLREKENRRLRKLEIKEEIKQLDQAIIVIINVLIRKMQNIHLIKIKNYNK